MEFKVVEYRDFKRAKYYSVQEVGSSISLCDEFFAEFEDSEHMESLTTIVYWIKRMGERGISKYQLRPEAVNDEERYKAAIAFPVQTEFLEEDKGKVENWIFDTNDYTDELSLRLYGLYVSDSIMILLCGCHKTDNDPKKCDNCRSPFYLANNFSNQLSKQTERYSLSFKRINSYQSIKFEKK